MSGQFKKKKNINRRKREVSLSNNSDSSNLELPDPDKILAEVTFVSPKGTTYQILKTNEKDLYETEKAKKESDS